MVKGCKFGLGILAGLLSELGKYKQDKGSSSSNASASFPNYQDVKVAAETSKNQDVISQDALSKDNEGADRTLYIRDVQKALNLTRKLDNRGRRLAEDKETRMAQWAQYQQDLRDAFLQQLQTYNKDIAKIDAELEALQDQKLAAKQNLTAIMEGKHVNPVRSEKETPHSTQDMAAWENLIGTAADMDMEDPWETHGTRAPGATELQRMMKEFQEGSGVRDELLRSQLRRLQDEIREMRKTQAEERLPTPATPPAPTSTGCPLTPQRPVLPGQPAPRPTMPEPSPVTTCSQDPYMTIFGQNAEPFKTSPNGVRLPGGFAPVEGLAVDLMSPPKPPRPRTPKGGARLPLKVATKTAPPKPDTGGASLAERVQASRDKISQTAVAAETFALDNEDEEIHQKTAIIDDDDDDGPNILD